MAKAIRMNETTKKKILFYSRVYLGKNHAAKHYIEYADYARVQAEGGFYHRFLRLQQLASKDFHSEEAQRLRNLGFCL